jgi:DNA helicase-2/ATP-dependent DNA helicase PcrA
MGGGCTYNYPDLLPCGRCHEGCDYREPETTPEPLCGTTGFVPCGSCRPGCVHYERSENIRHARSTGHWPDGAPYANPSYIDPWSSALDDDGFDWSTGEFRDELSLDDDGFDWSTGEFTQPSATAQKAGEVQIVFNEAQRECIEHYTGAALVIAGAGSGKTGAVTARIVRLVDRGVEPSQILGLTFTRKAATEMRERVADKLGGRAEHVTISTFQEMRRIIKAVEEELTEAQARNDELPFDSDADEWKPEARKVPKLPPPAEVIEAIGNRKTQGLTVIAADFLTWIEQNLHPLGSRLVKEYESLKQAANAVDYDDLIWMAVRLLEEREDILERYRERWMFVMVDEYQDTNDLQERFLGLLVGPRGNVMAVGDEDQSIYGWRGANVQHILTFTQRYPGASLIELGQNYRSTVCIVAAAAAIVGNNEQRREKRLWTENEAGWPVEYPEFLDPFHEADYIARMIAGSIDQGWVPEEHAVLVRTRRQFIALQHALTMLELPYKTVGWIDFWQRADVKLVLSWFKVSNNPQDTNAAALIFSHWPRIGAKTIADWRAGLAKGYSQSGVLDSLGFLHAYPGCGTHTKRGQSIAHFAATYQALLDKIRVESLTIQQIVIWLYEVTGLDAEIEAGLEGKGRVAEEARGRKELRDDFVAMCPGETMTNGYDAVTAFLDAIMANVRSENRDSCITLSTIHSAKGLEWDHVWVAGMVEGVVPYSREVVSGVAELNADDLEEERRLAYVACTRARKRLVMSRYQRMQIEGRTMLVKPSRFIIESAAALTPAPKKVDSDSRVLVVGDRSRSPSSADETVFIVGGRR